MIDKPFCAWPWFHQLVKTDGAMAPCCIWNGHVDNTNKDTFFHSDFMNELRDDFSKGIVKHPGCDKCLYSEKARNFSQRQWSFSTAREMGIDFNTPPVLRSQEVNLSNVCNLKCRMCNQTRSTKWITDAVALGEESVGIMNANWSLTDEQAATTNRLMFLGGEPLMHQDEICDALRKIELSQGLDNLRFLLTTNVTNKFSDELLTLMNKTKSISIHCSIDSVGKLNEYIRSDSKWEDIVENVQQLVNFRKQHSNVRLRVTSVCNVFNIGSFENLIDWTRKTNIYINAPLLLSFPNFHDVANMPPDYKKAQILRYTNLRSKYPRQLHVIDTIIAHLHKPPTLTHGHIEWKKTFKKHNDILDARRHTKLQDVNLELYEMINS